MNSRPPCIALIDPIWVGHHPMYFGQFAAAFLDLGAHVVGFCPHPDGARQEIELACPDRAADWSTHFITKAKRSLFNGRFEGDPYHTLDRWQLAAKAIDAYVAETDRQVDAVFFPYLDTYLRFLPFPEVPGSTIGRPWGGLYLRNHHHRDEANPLLRSARLLAKGDALMRSSLCAGIGVLDERYVPALEDYLEKPVRGFPDVTLSQLPPQAPALVQQIREKAGSRPIIGLIGLERRKGMLTMLDAALRAHAVERPWYFVFAGVFDRTEFDPSEQELIESVIRKIHSGEIDHIHFDPEAPRIPTEPEFNALFASFDLAWAAYLGFQGSSGTLGKAAAFEIPVIASRGECIGHRVEHYRLGATIDEGDSQQALAAIDHLLGAAGSQESRDFEGYRRMHSPSRLREVLGEWLEDALARK
ncbi:hypothetical protein HNR46_000699 [Haloferula luteola]|uniref:Uncharacterized protein n=1 Tax=Haloferula luteola TaxID=595692 RepID=A0A840UXM4_9BACT|nr:hypothetical protein [Haloferula luteola]MBB5350475.1 hypothetical protein [Haloferula luteola]